MLGFADVVGQKEAKDHLENALRTGRISHAYILCGEKGSGRHELAYAFSAALQCENPQIRNGHKVPCGKCHSCMQMEAFSHPDVTGIRHRKKNDADKQSSLGVDDIRRMRADVMIKPYSAAHKIYIVPDAQSMTVQAQNALLKTLEEPPSYAVIFLLADSLMSFLPTVLSRCVTLRLHPVEEEELARWIEKQMGCPQANARQYARLSGGNPGMARALAESEEAADLIEAVSDFLRNLEEKDAFSISSFAENAAEDKTIASDDERAGEISCRLLMLGVMEEWYHEILTFKSTGSAQNLIFSEDVQYIIEAAERLSFAELAAISDVFAKARTRSRVGGNEAQIMEMMLVRIQEMLARSRTEHRRP